MFLTKELHLKVLNWCSVPKTVCSVMVSRGIKWLLRDSNVTAKRTQMESKYILTVRDFLWCEWSLRKLRDSSKKSCRNLLENYGCTTDFALQIHPSADQSFPQKCLLNLCNKNKSNRSINHHSRIWNNRELPIGYPCWGSKYPFSFRAKESSLSHLISKDFVQALSKQCN